MAQIWLPNEAVNSPGSDATNFTTLSISHSTWGKAGHTNNHSRSGSACPMLRGPLGPVSCVSPSITGVAQMLAQRKPTLQWLHFWRALNVPNKTLKKGKTKRTLPSFKEQLTTHERTHGGPYLPPNNSSCRSASRSVQTWRTAGKTPPLPPHTYTQVWNGRPVIVSKPRRLKHFCLSYS